MARNSEGDEYGVSNPHPGHGKDPNIKNEFGHTEYPKWIADKDGKRVVVENKAEEIEVTGVDPEEVEEVTPKKESDKKDKDDWNNN